MRSTTAFWSLEQFLGENATIYGAVLADTLGPRWRPDTVVATRWIEWYLDAVAINLPCDDDDAGLDEYADTVVEEVGDRRGLIVVAQSLAGFTAPLVCGRLPVTLLVLVVAMVRRPGESAGDWWANTGHEFPDPFDPVDVFAHDLSPELAAASLQHARKQSGAPFEKPWPLKAWPDVPTRFLLCRDDRFFPADFQRRVVGERLG